MARMPGAVWLGEHSPTPPRRMTRYDVVCIHTIVGWAPAHAAHFSVKLDGTILQSRDTAFQSAGNLDGNHRVIVIENEDGGRDIPLTPEQVRSNAQILAWANKEHGIPLQLCPDSRGHSRGLAVHRQGIDGDFTLPDRTLGLPRSMWLGRVSGGEHWSTSTGKICPRVNKIAQVPSVLAAARGEQEDDDMNPEQMDKLADLVVEKLLNADVDKTERGTRLTVRGALRQSSHGPGLIRRLARALGKDIDK